MDDPFLLVEFSGISRRHVNRSCTFLEQSAQGLLIVVESGTVCLNPGGGASERLLAKDSLTFLPQNQCSLSPASPEGSSLPSESIAIGAHAHRLEGIHHDSPRVSCLAVKLLSPRLGHPPLSGRVHTYSITDASKANWLAVTIQTLLDQAESLDPQESRLSDLLAQTLVGLACRPNAEDQTGSPPPHEREAWNHPEIGPVLREIQQLPEFDWTVASMADRVQISRSSFAAKFTDLVGVPPMKYLLQCRMAKAAQLITEGRLRFKQIAGKVGYKTEAAFNTAFKRWSGVSPGEYRRFAASYRPPVR